MAEDFESVNPAEYYRTFLEQDARPDGRDLDEFRHTTLNIGSISTADGSALARIGNTSVMCGIKAEIATPKPDKPSVGFVVPNVELPALCSPLFKSGPPSELAQTSSVFINDLLVASKFIHLEDLCIIEGKYVWVLYCDMLCLNYDGNLIDACTLALTAALRNVSLPAVRVNDEIKEFEVDMDTRIPLVTHSCPVATSFAIFEEIVIADPTVKEEKLSTGAITVVTLDSGDFCNVQKLGGSTVTSVKLQTCIARAHQRTADVSSLISKALSPAQEVR